MEVTSTKRLALLGTALLGATFMASANAQSVVLTDLSGFSGNESLIDFALTAAQNDPVPAVDDVTFTLLPSMLAPRFSNQDTGIRPFDPQGIGAIDAAGPGASQTPFEDLRVTFPNPVNRVGFAISANGGNTVDITALNNGAVVAEIPFVINADFNFLGFETAAVFDELVIEIGNSIGFGFWRIDNLRYESGVTDSDGDGVPDDTPDNCPLEANPGQLDSDNDGLGDACDACPFDAENDADGDGACGDIDAEIYFDKAKVKFDDGKVKIDGNLSLPPGYWSDNLGATGSVILMLSNTVTNDQGPFAFEIKGNEDKKWEYKNDHPQAGDVKKFKIDWKGSKFDFNGDDGLKLKTSFIGGSETTLQVDVSDDTGSFTIMVNGTVIEYDAVRNITANVDFEPYKDDNKRVSFTLPYQLQPEMAVEVSGSVHHSILVADYYDEGTVKFKLETLFDPALFPAAGDTVPATLDLFVVLGETVFGYGVIDTADWDDIKDDEWKR